MFLHFWLLHPSFSLAAARAVYINLAVGQGQGVCQTTPVRHRPIHYSGGLDQPRMWTRPLKFAQGLPRNRRVVEVVLTDWASASVCKSLHGRLDL
ncbi:uncharacterized protein BDZ83DRAFT_596792 [Colletotrichum acutatum]|uniref:Secreted protein n=1 Tax=Glomerella acutata TaxID=27357 RepID=A0AAD9D2X6_GLOAC|nr:uncharacterized protein BDZ83DRAFT_596792 [Colletotrichum acutatum]KAK1731812.1 hypothetical protein BDZ83DRAFT_596792 [Colletotrichum acutatum]